MAGRAAQSAANSEARVVILEAEPKVEIEVVELPDVADVGTEFCHQGDRWRVTARRPRTRVLLARQIRAETINH